MSPAHRSRCGATALLVGTLLVGLLPAVALAAGPTATDDDALIPINAAATTIDVLANDVGTGLTIESADTAGHGTVDVAGDGLSLTYTPDNDYRGPDTFGYTVTDGALTDVGTVTVTVDDPPDATNDPETVDEDQLPSPVAFDVLANDTFLTGATISAVTQGTLGDVTIALDGLSVGYAPHSDAHGTDTFTYTLDDGVGPTDTATVTVTLRSVNDAPAGANKTVGTTTDTPLVFAASDFGFSDVHDSPPDGLSAVKITTLPGAGVLDDDGTLVVAGDVIPVADITAGDLQFTPGAGEHSLAYASFTFQVRDDGGTANGGTDLDPSANTITIDVTASNHPPVAIGDSLIVGRNATGTAVNVLGNDTDADLDTLSVTGKTNGTKGTVVITGGGTGLTYQPTTDATGPDSFTYTVSDGHGGTDTGTVSVTINNTNTAPVAGDDTKSVAENASATAVDVLANDTDAEHDTLTITTKTNGTKGVVVITGGGTGLTYQPNASVFGSDSFTYTISDGHGGSDTATVSMSINSIGNHNPVAAADSITMNEDAAATAVPVLSNDSDPDGDARTITGKTDGTKGVVVITGSGTGLTYKPNANANGGDTFTYSISDGHGGTATGTVTVTITPVEDPPNAVNDAGLKVPESAGPTALVVKANDTDPDGDTLTITGKTNGSHGTVAITGGGTGLTYDPVQMYVGNDVFSYTVSDGHGGSDSATVLVTVVKDTVAPKVVAPIESFYDQVVTSTTTREKIAWSASDPGGTGVVKYQVQVSVNSGSYTTVTLSSATATSVNRTLTTNKSYRFRVRATDRQGNVSAYVYGARFTPVRFQNTNPAVVYTGSWATSSNSQALGGSHRYSSSTSARVHYTGAMRDVAWIATKTTASGSAQVWIDGVLAATINLHVSSNAYHRLIFHRHFASLATHTIEIRPIGGGRVYLDAFTVDK
jgi:hypothetical protein